MTEKVKAHAETSAHTLDELRSMVDWEPFCLNALADAVADAYSDRIAPKIEAKQWNAWDARVYKIALRLSLLEMEAWEARPKTVPIPKLPTIVPTPIDPIIEAERLRTAIAEAGHTLANRSSHSKAYVKCLNCKR